MPVSSWARPLALSTVLVVRNASSYFKVRFPTTVDDVRDVRHFAVDVELCRLDAFPLPQVQPLIGPKGSYVTLFRIMVLGVPSNATLLIFPFGS